MQTFNGGEGIDTFKHHFSARTLNPDLEQVIDIDLVNGTTGQKGNTAFRDTLISIENISYKGDINVEMTGDDNDNKIRSAAGDDIIHAGGGNDYINSGKGYDQITSGSGSDVIMIRPEQASDSINTTKTITDFVKGEDQLALEGISFGEISINQGTGDKISHTILSTEDISGDVSYLGVLENVTASTIAADDFIDNPYAQKTFTASMDKWQSDGMGDWMDGPSMKLYRKDIAEKVIELVSKPGTPGHKHKEDMDKGSCELRVEHDQDTDGAINIDDVMGVLSISRGITQTNSDEHKLAADWNGDGTINIDDVMGVLSRSRGIVRDDEWRFYDKAGDKSLWDNASKMNKMDIMLEGDDQIDLTAILRGDVNASYNANEHNRPDPSPAPTPNYAPLPLNNEDELQIINLDII